MGTVQIRNARKSYGSVEVLHGVSIDIEEGEFVALVGPSGCGKSTLLRMIAGLEEITSGHILIGDRIVNDVAPKDRDIAMVFQNYALYPHKNVRENMAFALRQRRMPRAEIAARVDKAAHILGLEQLLDRKPRALSGGQRQRVAIARAILRDAPILLLDEATSALDAESETLVQKALETLMEGRTTLVIAHRLATIRKADRILVMDRGRIVEEGNHRSLSSKKDGVYARLAELQFGAERAA